MNANSPASDQDPVFCMRGGPGLAALERLFYDVENDAAWMGFLRLALEEGGSIVIERSGDWVIFPG